MTILERVQILISQLGLSERAFALKCGIKPTTLDMQLNGNRAVSIATITGILEGFPDVSAEWLVRGEGEMLKSNQNFNKEAERADKLIDTITTLQDALNEKSAALAIALERIRQLENQLK